MSLEENIKIAFREAAKVPDLESTISTQEATIQRLEELLGESVGYVVNSKIDGAVDLTVKIQAELSKQ